MDKINVLLMCNTLDLGGTEKVVQIFAKYLDKGIFNVYICGVKRGGDREGILRDMGFDVYVINNDQERLIELMKTKNINIVHVRRAGTEEPLVIMAAQRAGVPVIVEENIFSGFDNSDSGKLIDCHLLISKSGALRYQRRAAITSEKFFTKCRVLYSPIDLSEFDNKIPDEEIQRIKAELGIEPNDPVIGRIARPDIGKWSDLCLDMMPYLLKKIPNVKYIMMTIPESKRKEIEGRGLAKSFVFLEPTADTRKVVEFYNVIDVLAHSSKLGESFGCTIAEAMACKKPVVVDSTPLADNAQIELVDNGKTGFVASSPRAYAEAIAYLLENKDRAKEMGLAGYEKVKGEYEAKRITSILEKIYIELLQETGVELSEELIRKYQTIEYFPSKEDIIRFKQEYEKRLTECFGKPNSLELLASKAYEYLEGKPLLLKVLRKLLLTKIFRKLIGK